MDQIPTAAFNWREKASEIYQRRGCPEDDESQLESEFADLDRLSESYSIIS